MTKTDELLNGFAEYLYLDCKDGITLSKDIFIEAAISDLRTLIKQVEEERMPSEEEILTEAMERFTDMVTGYFQVQTYHAFIKGAKWFRNRMMKGGE